MRVPLSFALPVLLAVPAAAQSPTPAPSALPVSSPSHIEVRASATPLPEVLDRIARQTGMKVTYEGGAPKARVTTSLASVTPAQAVVSVMEGLGLNYLMGLDATSTRVETLLVVSPPNSTSAVRSSVPRGPSGTTSRLAPPSAEEMPDEAEPPEEDPMANAIMEAQPVDPSDPMGLGEAGRPAAMNPQDVRPANAQAVPIQPVAPPAPGLGWSAAPAPVDAPVVNAPGVNPPGSGAGNVVPPSTTPTPPPL